MQKDSSVYLGSSTNEPENLAEKEAPRTPRLVKVQIGAQLLQVGWLTSAGNVVTPVGSRENDSKTYAWKPVYAISGGVWS